jgi:hypothetical protein
MEEIEEKPKEKFFIDCDYMPPKEKRNIKEELDTLLGEIEEL